MSELYFKYQAFLARDEIEDDEDALLKFAEKHVDEALNTYNTIKELMLGSTYFAMQPLENRKKIINTFDYATFLKIDNDEEQPVNMQDISDILKDLFDIFESIDEKIEEISQ